jgi:phosphodiesterase/alkaline phosphatase D-like protein
MRRLGLLCLLALTIFVPSAAAASPTATTGPTTDVGSSTATVTGTVDPGGQSTTWHVEYGTSTSYGSSTATASAGSGSAAVDVSADLTGLNPGATYHYRIVATNGSGTSHGDDAVFTTLVPPDVTTGAATGITTTSVTLNGTVDPNGRSTTYYFEFGTSTSYGTKTTTHSAGSATSPQNESAGIGGLKTGTTYHFRIVAMSDAGTATGKDATFTTTASPGVATGDATSIAPTSATLNGTVNPNGLSTSWWFDYGTSTSYGSRTSSQNAGSGTTDKSVSAGIKSLKATTTYHYRLVAQNSSGKTVGDDHTFTTGGPPTVQTGAAQGVGPDVALLTGTLDTRGRSTTYWFDYGTSTSYGRSTPAKSGGSKAGSQGVNAQLTGLTPSTVYHYRLVAKSDGGTTYGTDATLATTGVTLTIGARAVVYGGRVRLSGIVPTHQTGEQVVLFAQAYGDGSPRSVATILTGAGGVWVYLARPQIATTYQASWRGGMSASASVGVHPRLTLTRTRTGLFLVSVVAGRPLAHRLVQLQRRVGSRWMTIRRVRLGARSRVEFRATLPRGRSTVRVALSVNQAGGGFLGGTSRVLSVKR